MSVTPVTSALGIFLDCGGASVNNRLHVIPEKIATNERI